MKRSPLSKELVAASSRPMVLSILAGGESYGYEILQKVLVLSGGQLKWSDGMLYPVLHRLEAEGMIESAWQRAAETGRRRRYYRLTRKGQKQLAADKQQWLTVHGALMQTFGLQDG